MANSETRAKGDAILGIPRDRQSKGSSETKSWYEKILRQTLFPILLMVLIPNTVVCVVYLVVERGSNAVTNLSGDFPTFWRDAWTLAGVGDVEVWAVVLGLAVWAGLSLLFLGGKRYLGPPTSNGFCPEYVNSGFKYYLLSMLVFVTLLSYRHVSGDFSEITSAWYWYKKMVPFTGALVLFGFLVCIVLLVKGLTSPSPGEFGSSGNPVFDFYWGLELYPRLGRWFDLKMWTNCRFGMLLWQLEVLLFWKAQVEHSGWNWAMAVTSVLQTVYIAKFFWWEDGYMKTIDIIVDHAGFYICWGCIVFVPTFYTLTSMYMVENAPSINVELAAAIFVTGLIMVGLNYWADYQRKIARETDGKCYTWGKPARVVRATYVDTQGKSQRSLLLASGFWGLSRHINYVFELLAALWWELPATFDSLLPYAYFLFLLVLLIHRSSRDEDKCRRKYGRFWEAYCHISRYQLLPGIL